MTATNNPFGLPELTIPIGSTTPPTGGQNLIYSTTALGTLWWNGAVWLRWQVGNSALSRYITAGLTDTASPSDTMVIWKVANGTAKAQTISAAVAAPVDRRLTITDDSGFGNITVTPTAGTIGGLPSVLVGSFGSITMMPDNANNWIIVSSQIQVGSNIPGTPVHTSGGTSYVYSASDFTTLVRRSNSGSAMADQFPPNTTTQLVNGSLLRVRNLETVGGANITITAGSGTQIDGSSTFVIGPNREVTFAYEVGATQWRPLSNSPTALLSTNNLSDLGNITTALSNLGITARRTISDTDANVLAADRYIGYGTLTTNRTINLLAASSYPTGTVLIVADESGNCSNTSVLTLDAAGSDTINGAGTAALSSAYSVVGVESDGVSKWTIVSVTSLSTVGAASSSLLISAGAGLAGGGNLTGNVTITSSRTINAQTGTTYTVANSDQSKLITFNNSSAVAVGLPQANGTTFINGWEADFVNIGAGTATITPVTSTINGVSSFGIAQGQGVHIFSDGTNYFAQAGLGANSVASVTPGPGLSSSPTSSDYTTQTNAVVLYDDAAYKRTYISGGKLSNDGGAPNTTIDIAAGLVTADDQSIMMKFAAYTKTVSSWALGTAAGALDTGAVLASTWYHAYVIQRTDTNVVDFLFSQAPSVSASVTATNASPCVFTWGTALPFQNGTPVVLTSGTPPTGFTNGTQYYVIVANIAAGTFQLSASQGGATINSSSTGSSIVITANPVMPASYTKKRRIGSFKTDASSHILAFSQHGDEFLWSVPVQDINGLAQSTSAILSILASVPPGIKAYAILSSYMTNATANVITYISSLDSTDQVPGAAFITLQNPVAAGNGVLGRFQIRTNTAAQIRSRASLTSTTLNATTIGWIDLRGKE